MIKIYNGDCRDVLKTFPDNSVHCVITSPPYFGLRDYGESKQIGMERTIDEYVNEMIHIFHGVKRVLRFDGTLWLNLGDSYSQSTDSRVKRKDLCGIPWRVALALQSDGWYLRSDIIWNKLNAMPESVTDRPTKSHEYLFLLTKTDKYFYDNFAIQEESHPDGRKKTTVTKGSGSIQHRNGERWPNGNKRNKRTVWSLPTKPFHGAHFATFPPALVEPCIMAGTSDGGCCPICGEQLRRIVRKKTLPTTITIGFEKTCNCLPADPKPCTVLDPFSGAGTTGLVAMQNGRNYIGIELNYDYVTMSEKRIFSATM